MASTNFKQGTLIEPSWLNDVNAFVYGGGAGAAVVWGSLVGNINNQADLAAALAGKVNVGQVVTQILAGSNIVINPPSGIGAVTISSTASGSGGGGTVSNVSFSAANGFTGSVVNPTTTPILTIGTGLTGVLKGTGTGLAAAVLADYPVMTATTRGFVPTPPNNTTTFLRGDGTWATPTGGSGTDSQITPKSFGAVGDGVADDTVSLQNTINAAAGRSIDLQGLTYKVTASLVLPSNTTIINGTLNGATLPNGEILMKAIGTLGTAVSMSNISANAGTFVVSSSTGIVPDSVLYLESNTVFGFNGTKNGELIKVRSVSGTTVTPYRRVYDYYASTPQYYIATLVRNITLRNVVFIGGGNGLNQRSFQVELGENILLDGCYSSKFGNRHFSAYRSMNVRFSRCHTQHSDDSTGLSYGITIVNGCDDVTIIGCTGTDIRHGVTVGGELGVDRNITITGCAYNGCTEAGIDVHPQAQFITITGNTITSASPLNSSDGLTVQGTDCTVTGNIVTAFTRVGIFLQPLCINSSFNSDSTICSGNVVTGSPAGGVDTYGIYYDNQRTGGAARVNISSNTVTNITPQGFGILVEINAPGSTISGLLISGNNVYARRSGIKINTAANKFIRCGTISNNVVEVLSSTSYDGIELSATTANFIERIIIAGNSVYGGRNGISQVNCSRIVANSNMIQIYTAAALSGTFAAQAENYTT